MMKKCLCMLLCLCLIPALALGIARMPERRGSVTDAADVLSPQTAEDLSAYAQRLEAETDIRLHVALVHFLDGAEVRSYAHSLFDLWGLGEKDLLLLGAAGEDSFAAVMGSGVQKRLGADSAENLLYTSSEFGTLFCAQQYDAAFAACCTALNALVAKQTGETIRMDGLFGHSTPSPAEQVQHAAGSLWTDVMTAINESSESYHTSHERREREENGLTAGGWIVLIVLAVIMLRQNKAERRYNRRSRPGCLGWILGLFGINILIDILRGRRR